MQMSWCRVEAEVEGPKALLTDTALGLAARPSPPLTVASLHLCTHVGGGAAANEVVAASVVYLNGVNVDTPMALGEWNNPAMRRNFSLVRKPDGQAMPPGGCRDRPAGFSATLTAFACICCFALAAMCKKASLPFSFLHISASYPVKNLSAADMLRAHVCCQVLSSWFRGKMPRGEAS